MYLLYMQNVFYQSVKIRINYLIEEETLMKLAEYIFRTRRSGPNKVRI